MKNESVQEILWEEPWRVPFFQAVRVLQRLYPHTDPVGTGADPSREVVRFRTPPTLDFPPSEIAGLTASTVPGRPPEMTVAFAGLTGPLGVLPPPYTELLLERRRYKDTALWTFLDLFTHRLVSLFYRSFEKYRFPIAYESQVTRANAGNRGDPSESSEEAPLETAFDTFTESIHDLVGMGTAGLRGRLRIPDQGLLLYAGLLAQRPHSASAVEGILSSHFGVRVKVLPFRPQWQALEDSSLTRLGAANSGLGSSMICGSSVQIRQSKFRLRLGPLTLAQFDSFLPKANAAKALVELTRLLVGLELDFEVQPVLAASQIPPCRMSSQTPSRLGWTTWISTKPPKHDADEVVFDAGDGDLVDR